MQIKQNVNGGSRTLYGRCRLELLRPGVLGGREDEVQPLQGVDSLMAELLPLEQPH